MPRIDPAEREALLARCTDHWIDLPERPEPCESEPLRLLARFRRLMREAGLLGFEATRLVARALAPGPVDPELERVWVEHARRTTVKRLRDEARVIDDRRRLDPLFGGQAPLGDAEWHRSLRLEPGETRARVRGLTRGLTAERYGLEPLFLRLPAPLAATLVATVEAARRSIQALVERETGETAEPPRAFSTGGHGCCKGDDEAGGLPPAVLAVARVFSTRRRRLPEWVGLLAMIAEFVETWDDPRAMPPSRRSTVTPT